MQKTKQLIGQHIQDIKKEDEMLIQDLVIEGLNQYPPLELEIILQMDLI